MKKHVQRLMSTGWIAVAMLLPAVGNAESLSDWTHSTPLVLSGYAGTTALTNFPVLVRLSEGAGGFAYADCRVDGADIRFSLGNGVALPHQRAAWNTSGVSEYWVRIPVLAGTATTIFVHWGNPAAAAEPQTRVWDDTYRGVWTLDGASGQIADASRHGHDGIGVFSATDQTGVVGLGRKFDRATTDHASMGYALTLSPSAYTYETWFRQDALSSELGTLMARFQEWGSGIAVFTTTDGKIRFRTPTDLYSSVFPLGVWNHVVATYQSPNAKLYVNGQLVAQSSSATQVLKTTFPFTLGRAYGSSAVTPTYHFNGWLDEARLSSVARSGDYAAAVFKNVASNGLFQSFAAPPTGSFVVAGFGDEGCAAVTPGYGAVAGKSTGDPLSASAPATFYDAAGSRYTCTGYTLHVDGVETDSGSGTSYSGTYPADAGIVVLTWHWLLEHPFSVAAGADGSVSPAGTTWHADGTNVVIEATPTDAATHSFYAWTGDCAERDRFSAAITLPADGPRTLTAAFGANVYVSKNTTANDANSGESLDLAKATIQAAVTAAAAGDTVLVDDGVYTASSGDYIADVGKAIVLRSLHGSEAVTLDGNHVRRNLRLSVAGAVAKDLTLYRGYSMGVWNLPSAVLVQGGRLEGCIVDSPKGTSANNAGVRLESGIVSGCVLRNGTTTGASADRNPAVDLLGDSIVEHCVISNNFANKQGQIGAAVHVFSDKALVANCLIVGNGNTAAGASTAKAGGVYLDGGRVENCTVSKNAVNGTGGGVYVNGGTSILVNSIVHGNTAVAAANDVQGSKYASYAIASDLSAGVNGNLTSNPGFADSGAGDFHLTAVSPAVDSGAYTRFQDPSAVDLDGNARVVNGVVDRGAYEFSPSGQEALACTFSATTVSGLTPLTVAFTAVVLGDTDGLVYTWDFGDGTVVSGSSLDETEHTFGPGLFTVSLTVENAAEEADVETQEDLIDVTPLVSYVSTTGMHQYPFHTWQKAATNVLPAVQTGAPRVEVGAGDFTVPAEGALMLGGPVVVSGAGPQLTVLDAKRVNTSYVWVNHADAVLANLTVRNGLASWNNAAGIRLDAGLVTNCVVEIFEHVNSGGIMLGGGTVSDCIVRGGTNTLYEGYHSDMFGGTGIQCLGGGLVENTVISNNASSYHFSSGAGIRVKSTSGGGVTIRNCLVVDNRNLAEPSSPSNAVVGGAGIYLAAPATVESCTITGNRSSGTGSGLYVAAAAASSTLRNNIVFGNATVGSWLPSPTDDLHVAVPATTVVSHSCSGDLVTGVNGNTTLDPGFRDPGAGDYTIGSSSPCANTGANQPWMEGARDLAGDPRVFARIVDMGAYECQQSAALLIIIR
ncbi:MAG: PKD domain-containing protein [Kiritimatiellae bacterium]|nr:PKD domain-containing protein [Kiritimatiellia bacterium]